MKETKKIGRNIFSVLINQLIGISIGFLSITLIPRALGPEMLGQFSYWISLAFILSAILDFGTSFYNRYIPEFKVKEPGKVKALLIESIKIDGFILIGLLLIVSLSLRLSFFELAAVFLGATLAAILFIFTQVFYSYEKLGYSSLIRNILRFMRIVVVISMVKLGIKNLLWAIFLPELITFLSYLGPFVRVLPKEKPFLPEGMKRYISFGLYAYLGSVCFMILGRSTVVLAKGMIGDLKIVGYTSIAVDFSLYTLRIMAISILFGAFPSGLRYIADNDRMRVDRLLELSWRYGNIIIFPFVFGFLLMGNRLVDIFIGREYLSGVGIMCSFLPLSIILFWLQAHIFLFMMYEKKQYLFYSSLISILIFMFLAMLIIPKIGIYGVPIALFIGLISGYLYAYIKTKAFKPIKNYFPSILRPLISASIMFVITRAIGNILTLNIILSILTGAAMYFISMVIFRGILREDYLKLKAVLFP